MDHIAFCVLSLVEKVAKKNRSHFPIAVLLTTLIDLQSRTKRLQIFVFCFAAAI